MRSSLALACLASVALAEASGDKPKPPKPAGDCATDSGGYYYGPDANGDVVCGETWRAWDMWCVYQYTDDYTECSEVETAWQEANSGESVTWDIPWMAMRRASSSKTPMRMSKAARKLTRKFERPEGLVMGAAKESRGMVRMPMKRALESQYQGIVDCYNNWTDECLEGNAECMTWSAYAYESDNEWCNGGWETWDELCAGTWTEECADAEKGIRHVAHVGPPLDECMFYDAMEWNSDDQFCTDAWRNWHIQCEDDWTDECDESYERFLQETRVARPEAECMNWAAWEQVSESASCNESWSAWDRQCWHFWDWEWETCDQVWEEITELAVQDPTLPPAVRPEDPCLTWEAYEYYSDEDQDLDLVCIATHKTWDAVCNSDWTAECQAVEDLFEDDESDDEDDDEDWSSWVMRKAPSRSKKASKLSKRARARHSSPKLNLAKAAQNDEGRFNYGMVIGSSVGVAAALGAIFTMSKCKQNSSIDDFQRA